MQIVRIKTGTRLRPGFFLSGFWFVQADKPNNCSVYWPLAATPTNKKEPAQLLAQFILEEIRVDIVRLPTNPNNVKSEVRIVRTIVRVIGVRK